MRGSSDRLAALQALRAVAALLVLLYHVGREIGWRGAGPRPSPLALLGTGTFGVDLFFAISGFVMVYVTAGRPTGPAAARAFLARRIVRIVPPYWLFSALFVLPVLLAPQALHRSGWSWAYLVASFAFVPWQRPGDVVPSVSPIYGLGWTLEYEMAFYLLFASLIASGVRRRVPIVAVLFAALGIAGFAVPPSPALPYFLTRTLLVEFVAGAGVASLFLRGVRLERVAGVALAVAGVVLWIAAGLGLPVEDGPRNIRGLVWGAAASAILAAAVLSPAVGAAIVRAGGRPLQRIGDASFSLYLTHLFVLRAVSLALRPTGAAGDLLFGAAVIVGACLVALVVHRILERPLLDFGSRLLGVGRIAPAIR